MAATKELVQKIVGQLIVIEMYLGVFCPVCKTGLIKFSEAVGGGVAQW